MPLILDDDYRFELGKAKMLRDGKDALIISSGFMTMRALEAVEQLKDDRVDVGVLHVSTIKPLDEETIKREAARSGRMVIVAENHTIVGGLGEAVAGLLLRSGITPGLQADRAAGRVPGRRRPADPARSLRHLGGGDGELDQGLDVMPPAAGRRSALKELHRIRRSSALRSIQGGLLPGEEHPPQQLATGETIP